MTAVEKTTYGETYVMQDDGTKVIPESKRPDGTVRPPIRVKAGYTPGAETRYDAPGKKADDARGAAAYPTGYESASVPLGERRIPGLSYDADGGKPEAKKKSRRRKGKNTQAEEGAEGADEEAGEVAEAAEEVGEAEVEVKQPEPAQKAAEAPKAEAAAETVVSKLAEEEKLMRKAKKKLTEIETLEKRGPPYTPEEEAKVSKKADYVAEIKYLEKVQKGQSTAPKGKAAAAPPSKKQEPAPKKQEPAPTKPEAKPAKAEPAPEKKPTPKNSPAMAPAAPKADPAEVEAAQKRIRNVKKKLAEIEKLKGSGKELDADQKEKVSRKSELDAEMKHLNKILGL
jgi:partner of Y14 and mago protein